MAYESTTPTFGLPQWVESDEFQMEDFNQAFAAIDEAAMPIDAVADFVEEQGATQYWQYRKWKSGRAEAWYQWTYPTLDFTDRTGSGSLCEMALFKTSVDLPSGLFAASPNIVTVAVNRGTSAYPMGGYINERSASSLGVVVWSTFAEDISTMSIELYVVGRWK